MLIDEETHYLQTWNWQLQLFSPPWPWSSWGSRSNASTPRSSATRRSTSLCSWIVLRPVPVIVITWSNAEPGTFAKKTALSRPRPAGSSGRNAATVLIGSLIPTMSWALHANCWSMSLLSIKGCQTASSLIIVLQITDVSRQTSGGFSSGSLQIQDFMDESVMVEILFQNENLMAYRLDKGMIWCLHLKNYAITNPI